MAFERDGMPESPEQPDYAADVKQRLAELLVVLDSQTQTPELQALSRQFSELFDSLEASKPPTLSEVSERFGGLAPNQQALLEQLGVGGLGPWIAEIDRKARDDQPLPESTQDSNPKHTPQAQNKSASQDREPSPKPTASGVSGEGEKWFKWSHTQTVLSWVLGIAMGAVLAALGLLAAAHIVFWKLVLGLGLLIVTLGLPCFTWVLFQPRERGALVARTILTPIIALAVLAGDWWCISLVTQAAPQSNAGQLAASPTPIVAATRIAAGTHPVIRPVNSVGAAAVSTVRSRPQTIATPTPRIVYVPEKTSPGGIVKSPRPVATRPPQVVEVAPAGRHLTATQVSILRDRLVGLKGHNIGVWADMNDSEAIRFAQQFSNLFRNLEFSADGRYSGEFIPAPPPPPPLSVECWTSAPLDGKAVEVQDALALRGALIAAGLLDDTSRINVHTAATLTGTSHFSDVVIGPEVSE